MGLAILASSVPGAEADELRGVDAGAICNGFRHEGESIEEVCEISVWEAWEGGPKTAPSGVVTVDHTTPCELQPVDLERSVCTYATMAPIGREFTIVLEYPGDARHLSTWVEEGWAYPPGDTSWAGPPRAPLPLPHYEIAPPAPSTSSRPARPRPQITHGPAKRTYSHLAGFRFAGDGGFECALDRRAFRPCGSTLSRHVSTGSHVLRLRLSGGDGTVVAYRWRVLPRRS
jgi:hypothetical protein